MNILILAQDAPIASLHVSWTLAEVSERFTDTELIKTCAFDIFGKVLSHDEKNKKTAMELIKQVPLWLMATRRIDILCSYQKSEQKMFIQWSPRIATTEYRTDIRKIV